MAARTYREDERAADENVEQRQEGERHDASAKRACEEARAGVTSKCRGEAHGEESNKAARLVAAAEGIVEQLDAELAQSANSYLM